MSAADVLKRHEENELLIGLRLRTKKEGPWIHIHISGPKDIQTTVTNNPGSVHYHQTLYRDLRRTLLDQGCWPYGDEGAEAVGEIAPVPQILDATKKLIPRFQPIRAKGGASASEIVLRDRGEY